MNKKILILLSWIVIAVLIVLCVALFVLQQGGRSPSADSPSTGTDGTANETPVTPDIGADNEIDFGDLLNPDADDNSNADAVPPETEGIKPDEPTEPVLPGITEGGNGGYSNGWY